MASADRIGRLMRDGLDIEGQLLCGAEAAVLLLRRRTQIFEMERSALSNGPIIATDVTGNKHLTSTV